MAILNKEAGCVVLRIVYAGAPLSGKTESLRSLSGLLFGQQRGEEEFYSPDDTNGRTLYFDWLNYTGGYFRGYKVNCQLVSVPGQKTLQSRRKLLLKSADVVVFVVDSEADKLDTALNYFQEMRPWLEREDEPPIGVVIQANKRDSQNALPMSAIYAAFQDSPNILALETIATKNSGIREAFVASVRIGLERASWLLDNGKMLTGVPDLSNGDGLLDLIQSQETIDRMALTHALATEEAAPSAIQHSADIDFSPEQLSQIITDRAKEEPVSADTSPKTSKAQLTHIEQDVKPIAWQAAAEAVLQYQPSVAPTVDAIAPHAPEITLTPTVIATDNTEHIEDIESTAHIQEVEKATLVPPNLPHKDVIAGSVFPPISGRIILHRLAEEDVTSVNQPNDTSWEVRIGQQWLLLSRAEDCFASSTDARMHLLRYANTHKKLGTLLSEHRCMAIVESDQHNEWRVWQIVRHEATLDALLTKALTDFSPQRIAEKVYILAENFVDAYQLFSDSELHLSLEMTHIGLNQNRPIFTGYIPQPSIEKPQLQPVLELLKHSFKQPISSALQNNSALAIGVPYILHPLDVYAKEKSDKKAMVEVLRTLFIGEH